MQTQHMLPMYNIMNICSINTACLHPESCVKMLGYWGRQGSQTGGVYMYGFCVKVVSLCSCVHWWDRSFFGENTKLQHDMAMT